jgi:hypothetical protein
VSLDLSNYEERTREAVAHFWRSGEQATANQALKGKRTREIGGVQPPEPTWMGL